MLEKIIQYSIRHKLIVFLFTAGIVGYGLYALSHIPIGAVPDITNNQVQVITTSKNLATEDVEKFLTYPVELEMTNLPGVKEIRSISKFGLSVVTIVFDDKVGTYLPRQLIAEKIKNAEEKIPEGFGTPFMGPITTGLGEIYQYVIDVDPEFKDNYSLSDLRTIQDWIVKRQLSGIPGVVEVNTWGGYLKQYEVAINPERLRAMNVSVFEVYDALKANNSVAGGGYIEKVNQAYFVRGEGLVNNIPDIENIVVTNRNGVPVYIKDVATVGFGHANRFGAITGNGEGEKVLGQVMMLKGADSNEVIKAVKARVAELQNSLPEGVKINAFLERSELIAKTTFTIAENLILGCLIVIFVVVLLLGNFRSGLVVASVIPLCLLFALSLMYIFGVDANLMSLGAIDFGIIVDGSVIIVEFIAFRITSQRNQLLQLPKVERQKLIDKITFQGATKMMNSAVFGQLIIIIVFIPILSLTNVEGKMFKPMALVFCFALIGAMLLCFTYVPVMASVFIKPGDPNKKTISRRLITWLENSYRPVITWALKKRKLVIALAVSLLVGTAWLYSRMGGEFVPTLDEGDFVIQPVLKTGTSLSRTIEATTKMEQVLKTFPEVDQVVTRIGAAEVPTDPMSMEESDVMIKLKPKGDWTSAETKDELADKFKEALTQQLPGVDYEFTQPIEMRFNELITGVRADVAIKVFGEDLDILYKKGLEIQKAIEHVEGAADISVEKIAGLPQMSVTYNRQKIAKYGLNIEDLNRIVTMGFAGASAGTVFEGEKQFDLVVRFDQQHRSDIQHLETASITLPDGRSLPLSEFADITYTKGPAKISRDNTKRRIVVGINVRNRDLESVVNDVQKIIEDQVHLPPGYTISYGGQFENLQAASQRLKVAVPIALILIFVLLYFAFNSVKEALMIYSAIPLSAIGGVLLLYLRGMPFSISAGVGFIALFGIAVLNGIVLIEEFKELKAHGMTNIHKRILTGTRNRLRPVLLTASAAALGFLPMAISSSAGAEVQRPLATVVVGGLVTATLLTLIVLPVLYAWFDSKKPIKPFKRKQLATLLIFILPVVGMAQEKAISLPEAIEIAIENNHGIQAARQEVQQSEELEGSAFNLEQPQVYYQYDENNIAENGEALRVFGVTQQFRFPTIYGTRSKVLKQETAMALQVYNMQERTLRKEVSIAYLSVVYQQQLIHQYNYLDSLYKAFSKAASRKFELGATNMLEKLTAETKQKEVAIALTQSQKDYDKSLLELRQLLQAEEDITVQQTSLDRLDYKEIDTINHPGLTYFREMQALSELELSIEKQQFLPDIEVSLFQGTNSMAGAKTYRGFQAGLTVPLWFFNQRSKIKAAKARRAMTDHQVQDYQVRLESRSEKLHADLEKYDHVLSYYQGTGKKMGDQLTLSASKAYKSGEIDFLQYVQLLENARDIEIRRLESLFNYNKTVLELNYITE
ncbi:CusA/CzcA family heavy metal efflux RND transporter [Zhouia amylolytica]|uniref:CusA/CzcA family heavy metal efflux RND transporter n=1 Tax=Zhouia amylolytica TaxID=376730 RepID=UPI0020CBF7F8|nr:CusA/CzcA family heavy metal efflux RND transporter [Zhouia amylolytica]MCQ0113026.1 CusA/CzcA family heavy metal efflux RND transporter [Zhouia amylolytica]